MDAKQLDLFGASIPRDAEGSLPEPAPPLALKEERPEVGEELSEEESFEKEDPPEEGVALGRRLSIEERFELFHRDNPKVYAMLVSLCREVRDRKPLAKIGIAMLWERMRWFFAFEVAGEKEYKLNNDFRSRYARLLMKEPGLKDLFETRALRA